MTTLYAALEPVDISSHVVLYLSTQGLQLSVIPNDMLPSTACIAHRGTMNAS